MVKTTKGAPGADQRDMTYEGIYDAFGVSYSLDYIEIADITRHKESQIRLLDANPSRVNQYLAMFKGGQMPPPATVYQDGFEGYRMVDANHRVKMMIKAKQTHIWAYVITGIDETMARWLGAALNGIHGLPLSKGEIELGVDTGLKLDYSAETIAKTIGASTSRVNRVIRVRKFNDRAERLGINADKVQPTLRNLFSGLTDDSVFIKAVELTSDAEMTTDEWSAKDIGLLPKLKLAASEAERLTILQNARDDRETAIRAVKLGRVPHRLRAGAGVPGQVLERTEKIITPWAPVSWRPGCRPGEKAP